MLSPTLSPLLSFMLVVTAFEHFQYPWDARVSMLLSLCLLNGFQVLFGVKQVVKNIGQRSAPRLDSYEWLGVWDSMDKYLRQWAPPVFWNTPEQVQNPEKLVEYLEVCCHPGIPGRQCAGVWPTPSEPCSTLFRALRGKRIKNQATGTAAAAASPAGPAAAPDGQHCGCCCPKFPLTPAHLVGTMAAPVPAAGTVAERVVFGELSGYLRQVVKQKYRILTLLQPAIVISFKFLQTPAKSDILYRKLVQ